jgi:PAS domain S-box-containing protein
MSTIVILDDRPADRELLSTVLTYAGHEVIEAAAATDALRIVRTARPELVITDLLMPEINGYEFVRHLRADPEVGQTKVVFCSATYDSDEVTRLAEECGVVRVLSKPVDPETIIRVVAEVLGAPQEADAKISERFDREELRVLNNKLVQKVNELQRLHDDLRRSERQAAESLDFREVVMQTMAEGLFVIDADGRLVMMNSSAEQLLGFAEEELRGRPVHPAIHHQRADGSPLASEESELLKVLGDARTVRVGDDAFTRKDGSIFPVSYSAAPLLGGGGGRGGVVVFRDTSEEKGEETRIKRELAGLAWVGRIRDALDDGRFVLYAQPIVPLADGVRAEELLVRMRGQRGEIIAPGSFLPVAEKYKLIGEIDQWVLAKGMLVAAGGHHVHINLSADSISSTELLPLIEQGLRATGAAPANVVFEITETALMTDIGAGEVFAQELSALGCGIAIDDFGTGYGSLIYLQKLPISYLKIDIAFVRDIAANTASQHVVKAIVSLAQGFGQQTVAEGVESPDTLELLREYGVDFVQGFHLGRPAPIPAGALARDRGRAFQLGARRAVSAQRGPSS